jgi:hypothetical protein
MPQSRLSWAAVNQLTARRLCDGSGKLRGRIVEELDTQFDR